MNGNMISVPKHNCMIVNLKYANNKVLCYKLINE